MRILRFFIQILILAGIIGAVVYFFGGTVWLHAATSQIQSDARFLVDMQANSDIYLKDCQSAPSSSDASSPIAYQLRFTDPTHYNIEVVCSLIENAPLLIRSEQLPLGISTLPGSSGLYFPVAGDSNSSVTLRSLGKEEMLSLVHDVVTYGTPTSKPPSDLPRSQCSGFGYQCCEGQSQSGIGTSLTSGILDCPGKCFLTCANIPYIQVFTSDPPPTLDLREVLMQTNSLDVTFSYGIQSPDAQLKNVHIDFGDGTSQDTQVGQGIFEHTYTCQTTCRYSARISGTDTRGLKTVENLGSTIYIVKK